MARIKIEGILDHLSFEMTAALRQTMKEAQQGKRLEDYQLFRAFMKGVYLKCRTWEKVPDRYVRED